MCVDELSDQANRNGTHIKKCKACKEVADFCGKGHMCLPKAACPVDDSGSYMRSRKPISACVAAATMCHVCTGPKGQGMGHFLQHCVAGDAVDKETLSAINGFDPRFDDISHRDAG